MTKHLAQMNVAKFLYEPDDERLLEFMNRLESINQLADRSPGFVWRLQDQGGDAIKMRVFDDPDLLVNISVWQDEASFQNFVWKTAHAKVYNRKAEWFTVSQKPHLVMWYIDAGHIPTIGQAKTRLEHLWQHGSSDYAFGWDMAKDRELPRAKRCA